jgi:hypothetical protein
MRRAAIDNKFLEGKRAHLKRLRDEREAIEDAVDEVKSLADEIAEEEAMKATRETTYSHKVSRKRLAAPRPAIAPTVEDVTPAAKPLEVEEGTGLGDALAQTGTSMESIDVPTTGEVEADIDITGPVIHSGAKDTVDDALAPPGDDDDIVRVTGYDGSDGAV